MIRQNRFRAVLALGLVALLSTVAAESASKRETAAKHYRKAAELYNDLQSVPAPELGLRQYQLVVDSLRKVHLTDPSSGYCDDSLLHLAEVYHKMAERFGEDQYRDRAIETYAFLAKEYPHSKHSQAARAMAAELGAGPGSPATLASQPPDRAPQAPQAAAGTPALSDGEHAAGTVVDPSGSRAAGRVAAISGIRHHSYADGTRVVLEMDGKAALKYERLKRPDRLYIDLFGSRLADSLLKGRQLEINDRLLSKARLAQNRNNKSRIVLDLRTAVSFRRLLARGPRSARGRYPRCGHSAGATDRARPQPGASGIPRSAARGRRNRSRKAQPDPGAGAEAGKSLDRRWPRWPRHRLDRFRRPGRKGRRARHRTALGQAGRRAPRCRGDPDSDSGYIRAAGRADPDRQRAQGRPNDLDPPATRRQAAGSAASRPTTSTSTSDSWELGVASLENAAASRSIHELEDLVSKIALEEKIEESRDFATKVQASLHSGGVEALFQHPQPRHPQGPVCSLDRSRDARRPS